VRVQWVRQDGGIDGLEYLNFSRVGGVAKDKNAFWSVRIGREEGVRMESRGLGLKEPLALLDDLGVCTRKLHLRWRRLLQEKAGKSAPFGRACGFEHSVLCVYRIQSFLGIFWIWMSEENAVTSENVPERTQNLLTEF